jgi:hypothetical protein
MMKKSFASGIVDSKAKTLPGFCTWFAKAAGFVLAYAFVMLHTMQACFSGWSGEGA